MRTDSPQAKSPSSRSSSASDSRKPSQNAAIAATFSTPDTAKAVPGPRHPAAPVSLRYPPASGPITKPSDNAAVNQPNFFVRSSPSLRSAITPAATRTLPAAKPSMTRPKSIPPKLSKWIAAAKTPYASADEAKLTSSSGFRPKRSLS